MWVPYHHGMAHSVDCRCGKGNSVVCGGCWYIT